MSMYHKLCRDTHYSYIIKSHSDSSNNKLVIFTDSMSAPIIPILAYFFKEIIVIDTAHNNALTINIKDFLKNEKSFCFCSIHSERNFKNNIFFKFLNKIFKFKKWQKM